MDNMENSVMKTDNYKVLRQLGMGSYGSVHLAVYTPSGSKCVIKKIKISHMTSKELEEARKEVKVLSSLSHPFITVFRASCEEDGCLLIAMDYCGGGDLHTLITNRKGIYFPEDRILDWFVQLCLAMKYIHDRKILHRDIKAQNIFLTDDGKVRLGDFGIAKILDSTSDLARTCIGTPYYLSPEMCENKPYNNKSDIWALGCVLYEMITLKHAFEASNMKALILKIIKGIYHPIPARYSRDLRMLLTQIFHRDPQARPSISAILRKPFILKRVSRFISGCEEEELKASLIKRKCPMPASARRIPVVKRPSDITDPAAKYGVSQSLGKKTTVHRSPTKSASRNTKQNAGGVKIPSSMSRAKMEKLNEACRKKYQSEHNLLSEQEAKVEPESNGRKRFQKRSKSVPNAFRQNSFKSPQNAKKKPPSPVKLQLMLDSAGFKKKDELDSKHSKFNELPVQSSKIQGWFADERVTNELHKECKKMKIRSVDATALPIDQKMASVTNNGPHNSESPPEDKVRRKEVKIQNNRHGMTKEPCTNVLSEPSGGSENVGARAGNTDGVKKEQLKNSDTDGDVRSETSQKEVKDLANKSLKQQNESCSDDDQDESVDDTVELRQVMQDRLRKLMEERTQRMNRMVSERRQWAYQREKLETSIAKSKRESLLVENMDDNNKEDTLHVEIMGNGSASCESPKQKDDVGHLENREKDDLICKSKENINYDFDKHQFSSHSTDKAIFRNKNSGEQLDLELSTSTMNLNSEERQEPKSNESIAKSTSHCTGEVVVDKVFDDANKVVTTAASDSVLIVQKVLKEVNNAKIIDNGPTQTPSLVKGSFVPQDTVERNEEIPYSSLVSTVRVKTMPANSAEESVQNERKQCTKICSVGISGEVQQNKNLKQNNATNKHGVCKDNSKQDTKQCKASHERLDTLVPNIAEKQEKIERREEEGRKDTECSISSTNTATPRSVTPSKRARWGTIHTAGLEKSPLESTGSEMEATSSSDLVVVYREFGERKQWERQDQDVLSILSQAQIIESPVNRKLEKRKEITEIVKSKGSKPSDVSNTPTLNSTFTVTLKERCNEGCRHDSKSKFCQKSVQDNNVSDNKKKYSVKTQPELNSTFIVEENKQDNKEVSSEAHQEFSHRNTNEKTCFVGQAVKNEHSGNIDFGQTIVLKPVSSNSNSCQLERHSDKDLSSTFTIANDEENSQFEISKAVPSASKNFEKSFCDNSTADCQTCNVTAAEDNSAYNKVRGALLERFRHHVSPQIKKKYQVCSEVDTAVHRVPSAKEEKLTAKTADPDSVLSTEGNKPSKKKGRIKSGFAGILRKLSSKHDVKSVEGGSSFEKDNIQSTEVSEKPSSTSNCESSSKVNLVDVDSEESIKVGDSGNNQTSKFDSTEIFHNSVTCDADGTSENKEVDIQAGIDYLSQHALHMKELEQAMAARGSKDKNVDKLNGNYDVDLCASSKDIQCTEKRENTKSIHENDSSVSVQDFESTLTSANESEEQLPIKRRNMVKDIEEVHPEVLVGKNDHMSVIQFDKVSVDSGFDTQRTNFTVQTGDNALSDTQTSPDRTLTELNQIPCDEVSTSESNITSDAKNTTHSQRSRDKYIVVLSGEPQRHSSDTEKDFDDCVQHLAYSFLMDVFEKAKLKVSDMDMRNRSDISPVSTSNIHINMNCSGELRGEGLQHDGGSEQLQAFHGSSFKSNTLKLPVKSSQGTELKSKELDVETIKYTLPDNLPKSNLVDNPKGGISEGKSIDFLDICDNHTCNSLKMAQNPPIARPTVLRFSSRKNDKFFKNTTAYSSFSGGQNEDVREGTRYKKKSKKTGEQTKELIGQCHWENEVVIDNSTAKKCVLHRLPYQKDGMSTASDEESEDLANLRQSMELLLSSGEQHQGSDSRSIFSSCSSEVWHLDRDGAVVSGGGGVYGWIEEQRAKIEDILGLELFIRAYHHLEEAQERDGCVVGEAVSQVEEMLGPKHCHLAYDILQLVVAEAVYHD